MTGGLYYYKLQSPYDNDVTKNCKLTVNEIDSNFLTLKDADIKSAEFIREDKTLLLTRNNDEKLIVDLSDVTYDLNVSTNCTENGASITISFDGKDGNKEITFGNLVTVDNIKSIIGSDILTKVITDGTLSGNGTLDSPLGINGVEKTGFYAPAIAKLDLTNGEVLPEVAKLGTRYVTAEYINDYGYLYDIKGVNKISENLEEEGKGWRIPTKADWDVLLNSIEPCEYQNHNSAKCHVELGKYAGKFLKSECGWIGQNDCECTVTKPLNGCTSSDSFDYADVETDESGVPVINADSPSGVDKYGMCVLPAGAASLNDFDIPEASGFKSQAFYWTASHVYNDCEQDYYVKEFSYKKSGVLQEAECPSMYYSIRLVKDYDGSNYFDTEYIDGIPYKTILFPESGQIWLASNYAKKEGFTWEGKTPELTEVNNGEIIEKRKVLFINEWNGRYWEKKLMSEGDTIVIQNACVDVENRDIEVCWETREEMSVDEYKNYVSNSSSEIDSDTIDSCFNVNIDDMSVEEISHSGTNDNNEVVTIIDGYAVNRRHCMNASVIGSQQNNLEYRVYTTDGCNQDVVNVDDIVVERVLKTIMPIIGHEAECRKAADDKLNGIINEEIERAQDVEKQLWDALNGEISARTDVEGQIWEAIAKEASARTDVDNQQWEAIGNEIAAREDVERQIWEAIAKEASAREDVDNQQWDAIVKEVSARTDVDNQLWEAIAKEAAAREDVDNQQWDAINNEITRATKREDEIDGQLIDSSNQYTMSASSENNMPNMTLKSKDGNEEHFIKVLFDGNFGEI